MDQWDALSSWRKNDKRKTEDEVSVPENSIFHVEQTERLVQSVDILEKNLVPEAEDGFTLKIQVDIHSGVVQCYTLEGKKNVCSGDQS